MILTSYNIYISSMKFKRIVGVIHIRLVGVTVHDTL